MRLGICGWWSNARGNGIVNQRLYEALVAIGADVSVFARPVVVHGRMLPPLYGLCKQERFRVAHGFDVDPATVRTWAQQEKIEAVIFGEEYNFELAMAIQREGIKTIQWVDAYLAASWRPLLKFYDQLWCVTHRAETILQEWDKADKTCFVGWGVPPDLWPAVDETPRFDFMHQAGWIGMDARKGTDTLLAAMECLADEPPELLLHCQLTEAEAKEVMGYQAGFPPHVIYEDRDVPPPGLYRHGRVVVQPSKIEGIGLGHIEAMCAGRPIITVDAAPMNEFVTPETGWLVKPEGSKPHVDGSVYQQALISPMALAHAMDEARHTSDEVLAAKVEATKQRARELFDWHAFQAGIIDGLAKLGVV